MLNRKYLEYTSWGQPTNSVPDATCEFANGRLLCAPGKTIPSVYHRNIMGEDIYYPLRPLGPGSFELVDRHNNVRYRITFCTGYTWQMQPIGDMDVFLEWGEDGHPIFCYIPKFGAEHVRVHKYVTREGHVSYYITINYQSRQENRSWDLVYKDNQWQIQAQFNPENLTQETFKFNES